MLKLTALAPSSPCCGLLTGHFINDGECWFYCIYNKIQSSWTSLFTRPWKSFHTPALKLQINYNPTPLADPHRPLKSSSLRGPSLFPWSFFSFDPDGWTQPRLSVFRWEGFIMISQEPRVSSVRPVFQTFSIRCSPNQKRTDQQMILWLYLYVQNEHALSFWFWSADCSVVSFTVKGSADSAARNWQILVCAVFI